MHRRVLSLLVLLALPIVHSARAGHCHDGAVAAKHDARPHVHFDFPGHDHHDADDHDGVAVATDLLPADGPVVVDAPAVLVVDFAEQFLARTATPGAQAHPPPLIDSGPLFLQLATLLI